MELDLESEPEEVALIETSPEDALISFLRDLPYIIEDLLQNPPIIVGYILPILITVTVLLSGCLNDDTFQQEIERILSDPQYAEDTLIPRGDECIEGLSFESENVSNYLLLSLPEEQRRVIAGFTTDEIAIHFYNRGICRLGNSYLDMLENIERETIIADRREEVSDLTGVREDGIWNTVISLRVQLVLEILMNTEAQIPESTLLIIQKLILPISQNTNDPLTRNIILLIQSGSTLDRNLVLGVLITLGNLIIDKEVDTITEQHLRKVVADAERFLLTTNHMEFVIAQYLSTIEG